MVFTELRFFVFFLVVFGIYWSLRTNTSRKVFVLAASYAFYAAWDYRFLSLLWASTLVDYQAGRVLSRGEHMRRKRWLAISIVVNLAFLGFFKYYDFFAESAMALAHSLGFAADLPLLRLILPVGISFYTFMSMSYTIDVYRGHPPAKSFLDFASFVAFFPHLVAGPILRASQFLVQFYEKKRWADVDVRSALVIFLVGFVKKACVADNVAPVVDQYFADPAAFDAVSAAIAVVCYAVQIYCDFSGYTDMATGVARLLGYELTMNFDFPYLAASITEFWRRWHMSLSIWLRDYLYIPLGGNRGSKLSTYRNLLITMLLGGLWHGADWTFVIWGGLHGVYLAIERMLGVNAEGSTGVRRVLRTALTFYLVCIAWVFFRAQSVDAALITLRSFVLWQSPGERTLSPILLGVLVLLAATHVLAKRNVGAQRWRQGPDWAFALAYGLCFALAVGCVPLEHRPFIYFQF